MAEFMKWYHSAIDNSLYAWFHFPQFKGEPWKLLLIRADGSWLPSSHKDIHTTNKVSYREVKPDKRNLRALLQIVLDGNIKEWF